MTAVSSPFLHWSSYESMLPLFAVLLANTKQQLLTDHPHRSNELPFGKADHSASATRFVRSNRENR